MELMVMNDDIKEGWVVCFCNQGEKTHAGKGRTSAACVEFQDMNH